MLYLILAIISSMLVSVCMRLGEKYVKNTFILFLTNYTVCSAVSLFYMGRQPVFPTGEGVPFALGVGLSGGVLFLVSFLLLQLNIRRNGVVLSSIFMRLGVLVPLAMAVLIFGEVPGSTQIIGFLLAVAAIIVLNMDQGSASASARGMILLLALLLLGGLTDSLINIYDKLGNPTWKDHFLLYIFGSAALLCLAIAVVQRKPIGVKDVLFGMLVGVPNYFSSRFLMLSLSSVPAIVAYPVYNVGTIALITLCGVLLFQEHLSRRRCLGIGIIAAALVLLNL